MMFLNNRNRNVKIGYYLTVIGLYFSWAVLGTFLLTFMFFIIRVFLLEPQLNNALLPEFHWLESLIHTKQSINIQAIIHERGWFSDFLRWYPQNLLFLGVLSYFFRIILVSFIIHILLKLKTLFETLGKNKIFDSQNVSCVKDMAYSVLFLTLTKLVFAFSLEISWLLFGLLLLILSNIFQYGSELEEREKLTI